MNNREKVLVYLVVAVSVVWPRANCVQPVTFDQLLPMTTYRRAYELCMRSWYGMRQLESSTLNERDKQDMQDCLLGRLVRLQATIKQLPVPPRQEHAGYLLVLLQHLEIEQQQYLAQDSLAKMVLGKSQYHLMRLLQLPTQER